MDDTQNDGVVLPEEETTEEAMPEATEAAPAEMTEGEGNDEAAA